MVIYQGLYGVGLTGFEPATPCPPVSREPSLLGATDVACRPESSTEQVEQAGTLITAGGLCISAGQSTAPLPRRRLFQVCPVIANLPTGPDHFGEVLRFREQAESSAVGPCRAGEPAALRSLRNGGAAKTFAENHRISLSSSTKPRRLPTIRTIALSASVDETRRRAPSPSCPLDDVLQVGGICWLDELS